MTRTMFFFMSLAAMLAAMTAVVLRIELAYPGASALFQAADGTPDSARFSLIAIAHSVFAHSAVMLLGTTMAAAAKARGARLTMPLIWIGIALSVALSALVIASEISALTATQNSESEGVGWVLYPPLSTTHPTTLFEQALGVVVTDPFLVGYAAQVLMLPAAGLLVTGAFAMLSTEPRFRALPILGILVTALSLYFVGQSLSGYQTPQVTAIFHLAFLPLLTFASIRLIDAAPDWLVVLTLGTLACMITHLATLAVPGILYLGGTQVKTALAYIFPLGLAFYALPALILFARRPVLPTFAPWAISGGITLMLALWIAPLIQSGRLGQPALYLDYPNALGPINLVLTACVFLFIAAYLALLTILRRLPAT